MRRYFDIEGISTEHLVGEKLVREGKPAGLVKVSVQMSEDVHGIGQLTPAQARDVAMHLLESAARAEYEGDVFLAAEKIGADEKVGELIATLARGGEMRRHVQFRGGL